MPFTNLLTNMVVLPMLSFDVLPTNTPAFQEYALHTMVTNARAIAVEWNLDAQYMSTNNITYELKPGVAGISGYILFRNRYRFYSDIGFFEFFGDQFYDNFAAKASPFDPKVTNLLTKQKALTIALSSLDILGLSQKKLRIGKPDSAEQEIVDWSDGKSYPSPLYQFGWETDDGSLEIHVSGITSNVVFFKLRGHRPRLYYPTNYFEMLGLPPKPVLVVPLHNRTNGWGPPYRLYDYQP